MVYICHIKLQVQLISQRCYCGSYIVTMFKMLQSLLCRIIQSLPKRTVQLAAVAAWSAATLQCCLIPHVTQRRIGGNPQKT